ncbi:hypothetical protein ACJJTC_014776, partial [Scirpophaga incertulas]
QGYFKIDRLTEAVTMEQYVAGVRVLLAACARGALAEGEAAARFLYYRASTLQRHPSLAYSATKAAAQYAALAHDRHRALTVSLATAGMELTDTLELRARTSPRPLQLPGLPTKVFVYATGAGCATVQGTITYSTYTPKPENALLNVQAAIIEEIRPERSSIEDLQGNLPALIIKTCFKWKGKERSGILRLESSLFSGYELHSVNPVVLDGATFADLHYGSRGESVWFVFANISSTCPVCVTYEARSKFIITSLRPAFAKIYPSSRPDLAVETFFHARPGSPLLKGITDDDFITWFDKTELASLQRTSSIDNICECGRICSRDYEFRRVDTKPTEKRITTNITSTNTPSTTTASETVMSSTTNLPLTSTVSSSSTLNIKNTTPISTIQMENTTLHTVTTLPYKTGDITATSKNVNEETENVDDKIIIPTITDIVPTEPPNIDNNLPMMPVHSGELIVQKIIAKVNMKKGDFKKKPMPRRKGTLKATYGDKLPKANKYISINGQFSSTQKNLVSKNISSSNSSIQLTNITIINNNNTKTEYNQITKNVSATQLNQSNINSQKLVSIKKISNDRMETSTIPHSIARITNSNIKTMHYRTKKPKAFTQIKKPLIKSNHVIINENKIEAHLNNTAPNKTIVSDINTEKRTIKTLKSINKEIHKIPPTPMSETSRMLMTAEKADIAPENKGGYEILDKNSIWELLKEGSDNDVSTLDDKLQVHSRLNTLTQKISNVTHNENRSL